MPWEQYTDPTDPRSVPTNWAWSNSANAYVYAGPPPPDPSAGAPTSSASYSNPTPGPPPASGATYNYAAAEPYGSGVAPAPYPDPSTQSAVDPAYSNPAPAGMPSGGSGTLYVPEWTPGMPTLDFLQPVADAAMGVVNTANSWAGAAAPPAAAIDYSGAPAAPTPDPNTLLPASGTAPAGGYATTPAGDNFVISDEGVRRFGEYEAYLAGQGGISGTTPPYATDPTLGGLAAPGVAAAPGQAPTDPGNPYGGGIGYGYGGGHGGGASYGAPGAGGGGSYGGGYPYPVIGGMPPQGFGGPPDARAFDPFLHSGVGNPLPPPSPVRNQIMQAGGFAGPAWYPAQPPPAAAPTAAPQPMPMGPSPAEQRQLYEEAMKIGGQIAQANQAPMPMSGLDYVGRRLKLNAGY